MSRGLTGAAYDREQAKKWDAWAAAAPLEDLITCLRMQESLHAELLERHAREMRGSLASLEKIHAAVSAVEKRPPLAAGDTKEGAAPTDSTGGRT